ncbi:hypothetical protein DFP72DRAFT_305452 [Ephemerocybe angulata]|uniref:Uncharacterized protein n=1 Tax=Ephemerocybe angulata TaxID=980116 RepID=A0A8H6I0Z2_9AGAR|nr:hypothetical protein DFP72DRAFT_305452 [Tulosesus angulatus]
MPFSINIPPLVRRPRSASQPHSFRRLRSFYLSPSATTQHTTEFSDLATLSPISGATTSAPNTPLSAAFTQPPGAPSSSYHRSPQSHSNTSVHAPAAATADSCSERTLTREGPVCNGDVQGKWSPPGAYDSLSRVYGAKRPRRMGGMTVMLCVAVLSVFLVMCLSLTFIGADAGEGVFKRVLDGVAANDPGVRALNLSQVYWMVGTDFWGLCIDRFGWGERRCRYRRAECGYSVVDLGVWGGPCASPVGRRAWECGVWAAHRRARYFYGQASLPFFLSQ